MTDKKPYTPRTPDRTGIFVVPGSMLLAAVIFSAMLLGEAAGVGPTSPRDGVMVLMLRSLAQALGLPIALVVVSALLLGTGVWTALAVKRYRARVREDRRALGLPD